MRWLLLVPAVLTGCVTATPARPVHWRHLVSSQSPADAVSYFSQATASADLCDARVGNDLLAANDLAEALLETFAEGGLVASVFAECLRRALLTMDPGDGVVLLNRLVLASERLLQHPRLQENERLSARLALLRDVWLERPRWLQPSEPMRRPRVQWLERAVASQALQGHALTFARAVLEGEALERGEYEGAAVDSAVLDRLERDRQDVTLRRMARRLPTVDLRRDAARRVISLRITGSAYPELAAQRDAVIGHVLRYGGNALELSPWRIERAWLEPEPTPSVVVAQPDEDGVAALTIGSGREAPPQLDLRDQLQVKLRDLSRPVTVCGDLDPFDPTPCVPAAAVVVVAPFLEPMGHGRFQFSEAPGKNVGLSLVASPTLEARVGVAGVDAGAFEWPTAFAPPTPVEFVGDEGDPGPPLHVKVDWHVPVARGLVRVTASGSVEHRIVERAHLAHFTVTSRGGAGERGRSGRDGDSGHDGDRCEDGGPGADGGDGGRGAEGGRGGDIEVELRCLSAACPDGLEAALLEVARSEGGEPGPGGPGGNGGRGGAGGPGRDQQCGPGSAGRGGNDGAQGPPGLRGAPGTVRFVRPSGA
ncbi:MAG: hypothetical protein SFW67_28255 [Myxococcaceae bacterium]|nr:hypothetical protein [Myxococcaceae bacterium]